MKCPICNTEFEKLARGGLCPNDDCKAPLKYINRQEDGEEVRDVVLRNKEIESYSPDDEKYETIYHSQGIKVEKSPNNHWIVTYENVKNFSWIHCPSCKAKMFMNNTVKGSLEPKCNKCKARISYVFK